MRHPVSADAIWDEDKRLLRILDGGLSEARTRAGDAAVCRAGCFGCCLGPFPITLHDALRLQRGLAELAERDSGRAARVQLRAREAMEDLRDGFPGDWPSGLLDVERADEELFSSRFQMVPCPALDLETGACELYDYRPVACRTYGLAVRIDGVSLTPCRLNYAGWSADQIEDRRVTLPLEIPEIAENQEGQTVVAAVLRFDQSIREAAKNAPVDPLCAKTRQDRQ